MRSLIRPPYLFYFLAIFFFYIILNIVFSGFFTTIELILIYAQTVDWFKLGISLLLTIVIGIFVSANALYLFLAYRQRAACKEESFLTSAGTLGGIAAGVCPLCVVGGFPLLLSVFGISFSFGMLPFGGIEVQVVVLVLLLWSYYLLSKRVALHHRNT